MLELKQTLINVNSFTAYYDLLFYKKNNIIYLNDKQTDYPELPRIAIDNKLVINKNNVFYSVLKDNIPCIEYNNSKKIAYYLNSLCSFDNSKVIGGIISFDNELKKIVYDNQGIYDLNKNEIVSKINIDSEYSFVFNIAKIAFFQKEKLSIIAYSLTSPQTPQWQFDLTQLSTYSYGGNELPYKVVKFLGTWQNNLLVACSNGLLLSLNINTGTIQHKWQHIKNFMFDDVIKNKLPRAESFVLDNDTLIGALNKFYFKINLNTSQLSFYNLEDELKKYNVFHIKTINDNPINDKHIYLTAMMRQKDNDTKWSYDCIVALNKKTLKIDWHYPFETSSLGTNIPKIANNKLYQLDNDNNLHIFEKTQNETT